MKKLVVLSLFDGLSCGQLALQKLGLTPDMYTYYASEIKPHAIKVTQHNFPDTVQLGDIRNVRYWDGLLFSDNGVFDIGKVDLLIGGSPCQNFSQLCSTAKRLGLEGEKSSLFYEYLRIKSECNPTDFFLENVASMKKKDVATITGYMGVEPQYVNSRLVCAQLRNRIYWSTSTATLKDMGITLKDTVENGYVDKDKAFCLREGNSRPETTPYRMLRRYYKGFNTVVFKDRDHFLACDTLYRENFMGLPAKEADQKASETDVSVFEGIRYLTRTEMERLQTVPEGYTSPVGPNEAASLLGDGWTVDVIVAFLAPMLQKHL